MENQVLHDNSISTNSSKPPIVIYILAGVILLLIGIVFFWKSKTFSPLTNTSSVPGVKVMADNIPIPLTNHFVTYAEVTYIFQGILKEVKDTPDGAELITSISGTGVPRFMPSKTTSVIRKTQDGKVFIAKPTDLQPGQQVEIGMVYKLREHQWYMVSINILPQTTSVLPSVTISAPSR